MQNKKSVLITILTTPIKSTTDLEYQIKNINNGLLDVGDEYEIDLEFIFWYANKPEDELMHNHINEFKDLYPEQSRKFVDILETKFLDELNNQIADIFNKIDKPYLDSIKGKIKNIKYNNSFQKKHNFKGYGAVHQFELITKHLYQNVNYDNYYFLSSNFFVAEKRFFKQYFHNLNNFGVPFLVHGPMINSNLSTNESILLQHHNINTFGCIPSKLVDFFENKMNSFYDKEGLNSINEKLGLGTTFGIHSGRFIKKWKHCINPDYTIKSEDFTNKEIFPFDDGKFEPAIQFPLLFLIYCTRFPETYNIEFTKLNDTDIDVPSFSLLNIVATDGNMGRDNKHRFQSLHEPYMTSVFGLKILKKIMKIDLTVTDTIIDDQKRCIQSLIEYLDDIKFKKQYIEYKNNEFFKKDVRYYEKIFDYNSKKCYDSILKYFKIGPYL